MKPEDIKILCIIPCFNSQDTIAKAVESVINQSHQNWELVIVDDASTDKSVKIIKKYLADPRITFLQNKTNKGCYYSRNRGLYQAKDNNWNIFTIHDSDDSSTFDRFNLYINFFLSKDNVNIIRGVYQGKRNKSNNKIKFQAKHAAGINWYARSVFDTFGYFDNTRFSGDKEYIDRIKFYLQWCFNEDKWGEEFKRISVVPSITEFSYCYTTHVTSHNLSIQNSEEVKKQYVKQYQEEFISWKKLDNFYRTFTPHKEDL